MRRVALGILLGTAGFQQWASVPNLQWSWALLLLIPAAMALPRWRLWLCLGIGFCWANLVAHDLLGGALPTELEGQDVVVEGHVISLPETHGHRSRFQFAADSLIWQGQPQPLPGRLLLSWYRGAPELRVGERWRLLVRLKQPHGFMNPGGFDYEAWLFRQGIRAKGYVRHNTGEHAGMNQRLASAQPGYVVGSLRQHLRDAINTALQDHPLRGIVQALAIGNRQQISPAQWDTLIRTGTSHLVAISGLHVGLVAGFAFFLARRGWRCSARAALLWPAHKAAAIVALFTASAYALLAGFSVPTQRALVMVAVVMLAVLLQRRTRVSSLLALALLAVLLLDPMAVLAAGFWLSFGAVAVIVYGMSGRSGESHRWWWRWGRAQWLVAVGLLPLLIGLFQQASLVAPLANLVAVPWVTLLSVPLTLLGSLLLGLIPGLGEGLLLLAAWSLQGLWWLLEMMGQWPQAQWQQGTAPWWSVACALPGVAWLLAPRGVPARWVGGVWLLPLLLARPADLAPGAAHFALLDVGQGLAAVVQTRRHVLVFDTGPRFSSGFNTGEAVLAPYLRARGIGHVDTLIVSHGDNDHRGGVEGLLSEIPVQRVLSSVPQRFRTRGLAQEIEACRDGQNWQWDGVQFTVLNPQAEAGAARSDNNRSCVLRVQASSQRLLLTGDIEAAAEQMLVQRHGKALAAELLVVPHHGSLTSSTPEFIAAVAPQVALFPVGYRNRFGFPKPPVVERYRQRGVQLFDTVHHGALEIRLGDEAELRQIHAYRQDAARYWHHQPAATPGRGEALATSGRSASLLQ